MSGALGLGCLWVLAATTTALLPMRRQMLPGLALLLAAPVLVIWIARDHGAVWATLAALAVVSMFRKPLLHLARRALGLPAPLPHAPARDGRS